MHKDRMRKIGSSIIPPQGSLRRHILDIKIKSDENDPEIQRQITKIINEAKATCQLQSENGAGLPADKLIREFNNEYNNRVFMYSLREMPSSFNIVEAFYRFDRKTATFRLGEEVDCIFSFDDFLDFMTSDDAPCETSELYDSIEEEVIYSFNSTDNPKKHLFSTSNGKKFGALSFSLIRHGKEISVILQAGQVDDLEKTSLELQKSISKGKFYKSIRPDKSQKINAVPLVSDSDLWRTLVLLRFDIETSTIDARYILQDAGQQFIITSDDLDTYTDKDGSFTEPEFEELVKNQARVLKAYTPLFEICKTMIFLPLFRVAYDDVITIERHPTDYGQNRNKLKYKKINKLASSSQKVSFRNVEKITPDNRRHPTFREFITPNINIETSGYWKNLEFQDSGTDKNDNPIQGRTWVNKTLTWKESKDSLYSLKISTRTKAKESTHHGYIYVMRSAAHDKNIFKVGLTKRTSEIRSTELTRTTSSPDHFLVVEDWEVSDCVLAEKIIHQRLNEFRINPRREFFKVRYKVIFKIINDVIEEIEQT